MERREIWANVDQYGECGFGFGFRFSRKPVPIMSDRHDKVKSNVKHHGSVSDTFLLFITSTPFPSNPSDRLGKITPHS